MSSTRTSIHGQWSSHWVFILAATGSAVGLGNVWKFPYMAGENGGGAFVLIYLVCVAAIGIPIMIAEVMLGRRGRQSPINTMQYLAEESRHSPAWKWLGWSGMIAGFIILSFYGVIAGWALAYVFRTGAGVFEGATADGVSSIFNDLISDPERLLAWHTIFIVMTMVVVARGVSSGLEKAVRFLMPMLFVLLLILLVYAMQAGDFIAGLSFLFKPDFSKIFGPDGGRIILSAMGHAFFTLSLGMGAIMMYGSYLPSGTSIAKTSIAISIADTVVALLAGMVIFPLVFANGLEPGEGPGLIFNTLPLAFGHMAGGTFFGTLFFILLVFAAWTSSISLIEPAVAWLVENKDVNRIWASVVTGILAWVLGVLTVLSFNRWAFSFRFSGKLKENGIFDILDILTTNIMLPLGGLFIALFAAWVMKREMSKGELAIKNEKMFDLWYFLVRYVTPVGVTMVFLNVMGVFG